MKSENLENDDEFDLDETEMRDLFSSLKQIQPTLEGKVQNRTTVAHELAKRQSTVIHPAQSWWQRSLASTLTCGCVLLIETTAPPGSPGVTIVPATEVLPSIDDTVTANE